MIRSTAIATTLFLATCSAVLASSDYRCVIEDLRTASSSLPDYHRTFIGREFTVERRSGVMSGALKNSFVTAPVVIDPGAPGNSYKVFAALRPSQGVGPGSNVYLLTINEFEDSPSKSFLFAQNDTAYFGRCVHF